MAVYAGVTTVLWSVPFGSKRVSLIKVAITNYNRTGIPLSPRQVGLGAVEFVLGTIAGNFNDEQAPVAYVYDPVAEVCRLFRGPDQEVGNDVNLSTTIGDVMLMVIGV